MCVILSTYQDLSTIILNKKQLIFLTHSRDGPATVKRVLV